ncbi:MULTISPECIES: nitrate reductase molybdenum cofactor assembly chaperone [Halomonas]|uniref:nitrate reductase molybdenum cofactor assembly chaperone n=1 Tax=Halomonas TaxID=2745 RepID=UPI001C977AD0|nr:MULTISPECIES: nitrate reductase molybdenum cofactor assembly chaperone [Halomonas]MBY5984572.1 nitrate reductase molybdenum cofactor assembly chaperone [Halomonas sp. DP5Y7-2]MBY6209205.1 nitrate reductase molybdenum cofactor assembly chaperone [Halomonas sp. DP3Y7-2]MBY6229360.1 nitrate reductase molybdenum cofactor assembly chaperone [Halomonas sp. DP3Y7-1]MCA0917578.1 nitrate reductase molybdenum cofactor assembly chaperone [Halomonas denitrificans]
MTDAATQGPLAQGLRALARLLDYPDRELIAAIDEVKAAIAAMPLPGGAPRQALLDWCDRLRDARLLDVQAAYVAQFDRGRATSLLLFEHVHGESRDRGQAMVDLLSEYEAAGFALDSRELPDHLPLLLEFLSTRSANDIASWIGDVSHILALLTARLESKQCDQALITRTLLAMIGAEDQVDTHREAVEQESPDNTPAALDAVWEEEAVRFSAESDQDCALTSAEGRRLAERRGSVQPDTIRLPDAMPSRPTGGLS